MYGLLMEKTIITNIRRNHFCKYDSIKLITVFIHKDTLL